MINNYATTYISLLILGATFFIIQTVGTNGFLVMPSLGISLIIWSAIGRRKGLMIPGGVLFGIGLGSSLTASSLSTYVDNQGEGGLFLLGIAAGWFLISMLTYVIFDEFRWRPLIVGSLLVVISLGLFTGSQWVELVNTPNGPWPVLVIIIGLSVIWKQISRPKAQANSYHLSE